MPGFDCSSWGNSDTSDDDELKIALGGPSDDDELKIALGGDSDLAVRGKAETDDEAVGLEL